MIDKIEEIILDSSKEVLWHEDGRWDTGVLGKLLWEAYENNLGEDQKILVTYMQEELDSGVIKSEKYKTLRDLKDNYYLWFDKEYQYNSSVVQNI